jgi:hypothetical protein
MSNLILYDYREVSRIHHWPFESPLALTVAETDFFGVPCSEAICLYFARRQHHQLTVSEQTAWQRGVQQQVAAQRKENP